MCKSQVQRPSQLNTMQATESNLSLFDRNNIAACAIERARQNVLNAERFSGEYTTVKMWTRYKCYISTTISYVEAD